MSAACRCGRPAQSRGPCAECAEFAVARQRTAGFLQAEADRQRALGRRPRLTVAPLAWAGCGNCNCGRCERARLRAARERGR